MTEEIIVLQMTSRNGRVLVEAAGKEKRATAALLRRQRGAFPYSGYAIIAKCSASLQSELQARSPPTSLNGAATTLTKLCSCVHSTCFYS